ncbi:MAG: type ISP restriction/modification enzyme [Candidatus Helarchaeota archaeon]
MTKLVETYLKSLFHIKSSGAATKETSYYPVLQNLLNEIGQEIQPNVTCIMNIANRGAGLPDGGLFSQNQFRDTLPLDSMPPELPSHGAIEVKGTSDDTWETAEGEQVSKYWRKYRQVLVTNYRDFLLIGQNEKGQQEKLDSFRFAESEEEFWLMTTTPRKTAKLIGKRFIDFIKRVMLQTVPLTDPESVAWFLASYAREVKYQIEDKELSDLQVLRDALEEAMGIKFKGKTGDLFFRSTIIQTLFYGLFSAWVLWHKENPPNDTETRFNWKYAAWILKLPMVKNIFERIVSPTNIELMQVSNILDWTESTLNRVDRIAFFNKFEEQNAVQYFYEPFLESFDPELRKNMGVWYTPPEIVQYMVARVDRVLREELGYEDGLANRDVLILDPAVGTGSFYIEILKKIHNTLLERGENALIAEDLKRATINRIFGFEILPAPFIVAHLQVGLFLQNIGAHFDDSINERPGIHLTNSLSGWGLPDGPQKPLIFSDFEKEREESDLIKREKPILVVIGNPPYNAFAGTSTQEEQGLVEVYKEGLRTKWNIKSFNLDDLYIKFFRLAERRIAEYTGKGIISYITNFSFLKDASFLVMRERFLKEFDLLWFDCMNGSSRETGKLTPEGQPDPSVFSTKYNKEGIRVGTAISLLVRKDERANKPIVRFRNFWGITKKQDLVNSLQNLQFNEAYDLVYPSRKDRFSFSSSNVPSVYYNWPSIPELGLKHYNGPIERRGNSLINLKNDISKFEEIRKYLDPKKTNEEISIVNPRLMKSSGEFEAEKARNSILRKKIKYDPSNIVDYPYKIMDFRLAYLDSDIQPLFSRPRPELIEVNEIPNNSYLITRDTADKMVEGPPFYFSKFICDYDCISGHARHFPIWIFENSKRKNNSNMTQITLSGERKKNGNNKIANLSKRTCNYLKSIGIVDFESDQSNSELIWMHILAIGFSPLYLSENSDGIRLGWPRIPLPNSINNLKFSVRLGNQISSILRMEKRFDVEEEFKPFLKNIGLIQCVGNGSLDPSAGDLQINANWGYHGLNNAVMPGKGKMIQREYSNEEYNFIRDVSIEYNKNISEIIEILGESTCDVYLNDKAHWRNIPLRTWNYVMGGHQVLKKWLSYREYKVLNRSLSSDEVREFSDIAKRLTVLLLLEPKLNENYQNVIENLYDWEQSKDGF